MRKTLLFLALCCLPSLVTVACTSAEEDLCDAKCDCEGCSDRDYDNCVFDREDDEIVADRRGCLDLYDEYVVCQLDTWRCRGADFDTSCGPERDRYRNCID